MKIKIFLPLAVSILSIFFFHKPAGSAEFIPERDLLVTILSDKDSDMRVAALKALRGYVSNSVNVRDAVSAVYSDTTARLDVRIQAVKTLSFAGTSMDVGDLLFKAAQNEPIQSLRVISIKALHLLASSRTDVRKALVQMLEKESDELIRAAAAWALYGASGDAKVRESLVESAVKDSKPAVRVEALKSLYGSMGSPEVRELANKTAIDTSAPLQVRRSAILMLSSAVKIQSNDNLRRLARSEQSPSLREAAILALYPSDDRIAGYFHFFRTTSTGFIIDPLDNE